MSLHWVRYRLKRGCTLLPRGGGGGGSGGRDCIFVGFSTFHVPSTKQLIVFLPVTQPLTSHCYKSDALGPTLALRSIRAKVTFGNLGKNWFGGDNHGPRASVGGRISRIQFQGLVFAMQRRRWCLRQHGDTRDRRIHQYLVSR